MARNVASPGPLWDVAVNKSRHSWILSGKTVSKSGQIRAFFTILLHRNGHITTTSSANGNSITICHSSFFNELRHLGKSHVRKRILPFQYPIPVPSAVVIRGIVAEGVARSPLVIEFHISGNNIDHFIPCPAFTEMKIHEKLLLYPAIERLVGGVVRRLPRTGH